MGAAREAEAQKKTLGGQKWQNKKSTSSADQRATMRCVDPGLRKPAPSSGPKRKQLKEAVKSHRMPQFMSKGFAIPITEGQMNGGSPKFGPNSRLCDSAYSPGKLYLWSPLR